MTDSIVLSGTRQWLSEIVIGLNFCPFAKPPFLQERIHFVETSEKKQAAILEGLVAECEYLDKNAEVDTSLFILTAACGDFYQYLDLLDVANQLLSELGYEGVYQLASFHPQYCFDNCDFDDASNYTNRSPWPMFHLIREDMLEAVLASVAEPEKIPERNIAKCNELGASYFAKRFKLGFKG